jgi:hypothetical protein
MVGLFREKNIIGSTQIVPWQLRECLVPRNLFVHMGNLALWKMCVNETSNSRCASCLVTINSFFQSIAKAKSRSTCWPQFVIRLIDRHLVTSRFPDT